MNESVVDRSYLVALSIPDNEAFTARQTLGRLGIAVAHVQRSDVWLAQIDASQVASMDALVPTVETMFNPNKHRLEIRAGARPLVGEVWIAASDETPSTTIGGRRVPGLRALHRRTAWRLLDERGADVSADVLARATATFLCNPAFQKAIR